MRVRDLIVELEKLEPSLEIVCYSEDGFQTEGKDVQCLDIREVSRAMVVRSRDESRTARIVFDNEHGHPVALIEISGDV